MSKKQIIVTILITAGLIGMCALLLAAQEEELPVEEVPSPSSSPTVTVAPTATPTVTPEPVPSATIEPTPEPTLTPETATPVPAQPGPTEAVAMGYGVTVDLNGDGTSEEVRFDPTILSPEGNIQLTINDTVFDTAIPAGSGGAGLYMGDILTSDPYVEMFLQVLNDTSSTLYVFRYDTGSLTRAITTYTLPSYLSPSGADEQLTDSDSIIFYGVQPILVMGDGSFGLLYGDSFTMFQLDGDNHYMQAGTQ